MGTHKRTKSLTRSGPFWKMIVHVHFVEVYKEDITGYITVYPLVRRMISLSLFYMKSEMNYQPRYLPFFLISHFQIQVLLTFLEIGYTFTTASNPHLAFGIIRRFEYTFTFPTSEVANLQQYIDK